MLKSPWSTQGGEAPRQLPQSQRDGDAALCLAALVAWAVGRNEFLSDAAEWALKSRRRWVGPARKCFS